MAANSPKIPIFPEGENINIGAFKPWENEQGPLTKKPWRLFLNSTEFAGDSSSPKVDLMIDRLVALFADTLEVPADKLNDESSPENTQEWDSLAMMKLVSAIEDFFAVELTTKEIMRMRTIGIARAVLRGKGVQGI